MAVLLKNCSGRVHESGQFAGDRLALVSPAHRSDTHTEVSRYRAPALAASPHLVNGVTVVGPVLRSEKRVRDCWRPPAAERSEEFIINLVHYYGWCDERGEGMTLEQVEHEVEELRGAHLTDEIEHAHWGFWKLRRRGVQDEIWTFLRTTRRFGGWFWADLGTPLPSRHKRGNIRTPRGRR